ncbi:TIGR01440 family protein [Christensenellaceae bacterium OttesenSCG-928-M15]|nr:TIGR01440 family protein [Christensenellaceae bacterium OttesenSCG-928-M15]
MAAITEQVRSGFFDLMENAGLKSGELFVVGCSTSEVGGHMIGTHSSEEIAKAIMDALLPEIKKNGLYLAVQCCEHLNRVLVVEREAMEKFHLNEVWVKPWLHAGGAFAMQAIKVMDDPVMVEDLKGRASAGIDIGGTFIGMHMHPVVVPIHSEHKRVGEAVLTMARTRPKYVGGPRAQYEPLRAH